MSGETKGPEFCYYDEPIDTQEDIERVTVVNNQFKKVLEEEIKLINTTLRHYSSLSLEWIRDKFKWSKYVYDRLLPIFRKFNIEKQKARKSTSCLASNVGDDNRFLSGPNEGKICYDIEDSAADAGRGLEDELDLNGDIWRNLFNNEVKKKLKFIKKKYGGTDFTQSSGSPSIWMNNNVFVKIYSFRDGLYKKTKEEFAHLIASSNKAYKGGYGVKIYDTPPELVDDTNFGFLITEKGEPLSVEYLQNIDWEEELWSIYHKMRENNHQHNDYHSSQLILRNMDDGTKKIAVVDWEWSSNNFYPCITTMKMNNIIRELNDLKQISSKISEEEFKKLIKIDWVADIDPSLEPPDNERYYYWNPITEISQWEEPEELTAKQIEQLQYLHSTNYRGYDSYDITINGYKHANILDLPLLNFPTLPVTLPNRQWGWHPGRAIRSIATGLLLTNASKYQQNLANTAYNFGQSAISYPSASSDALSAANIPQIDLLSNQTLGSNYSLDNPQGGSRRKKRKKRIKKRKTRIKKRKTKKKKSLKKKKRKVRKKSTRKRRRRTKKLLNIF
tara:strand:+ start:3409 stop:5085 length:1677 start_codon:yes stop_codon:yes gene_type:complete